MDWKHNQWVGVGAAILVVVGIVGVFFWLSKPAAMGSQGGLMFLCEGTNGTFNIPGADLEKEKIYMKYFNKPNQAVECQLDGNNDAYWVYYCPTCEKYYQYTPSQASASSGGLYCPKEHEIPEGNR